MSVFRRLYRSKEEQECRKTKSSSFYPTKHIKNDDLDNKSFSITKQNDKLNNFNTFKVFCSKNDITSLNIINYKKPNCSIKIIKKKQKCK